MRELKVCLMGLLIDGVCIAAMLMQAWNPGTAWDFWGSAGYFFQATFIWLGILLIPVILVVLHTLVKMQESDHPALQNFNITDGLVLAQNHSVIYKRWVTTKELAICVLFSGMGWGWLAAGNLICLGLMWLLWNSPKVRVPQAA